MRTIVIALTVAILVASAVPAEANCRCYRNSKGTLACSCSGISSSGVRGDKSTGHEGLEKSVEPEHASAIELTADTDEERWLKVISDLVLQGDTSDADAVIKAFHESFPSFRKSCSRKC